MKMWWVWCESLNILWEKLEPMNLIVCTTLQPHYLHHIAIHDY